MFDEDDTQGNEIPEEGQDAKESSEDSQKGSQGDTSPTDEQILERFRKGELFTQEHYNKKVQERLERDREARKAQEEEERRKSAEEARAKALKDQENFKELSETQAKQLEEKDTTISSLKEEQKRIKVLEDRLADVVDAQLEGLEPAYKSLLDSMTVEARAEWIKNNADLLGKTQPEGSPRTPPPSDRGRRRRQEQDQQVREQQRNAPYSRL